MAAALDPARILAIAPNWVGDSLFFLPAVDALKRRYPGARLDLLAKPGIAALLKESGRFDRVHSAPPGAGRLARFAAYWGLRAEHYDLAVVFPDSFSTALGAFLTGARVRAGRQGEGRSLFLSGGYRLAPRQRQKHVVDEYLELAAACGAESAERQPTLSLSTGGVEERERLFRENHLENGPLIGLCPTSAFGPSKEWPAQHWSALAGELKAKHFQVAFFCAPSELDQVAPMARPSTGSGQAPSTGSGQAPSAGSGQDFPVLTPSLPGLAACLAACEAVVANDSGPLHLAAAVGARCLGLYGPVDPLWSAPVSPRAAWLYRDLDCSPCFAKVCPLGHHDCLKGMAPATVLDALLSLLKK